MTKIKNILYLILISQLVVFITSSCESELRSDAYKNQPFLKNRINLDEDIPYCIENKIRYMLKNNPINTQSIVWKLTMQNNENYYYIERESYCSHCYYYIYDDNCEVVCAPRGGDGRGDGTCSKDLQYFNYKEILLIWKSFDV